MVRSTDHGADADMYFKLPEHSPVPKSPKWLRNTTVLKHELKV